ncbi:MAG: DNA polymerase III subunit gamma/tau [Clostridiales bacterium]|jgi:DNA polymerase-3 subunit gamma/tau|nr:DNA polymerase III subunit gamma/tau [Clostridiales bacterium]
MSVSLYRNFRPLKFGDVVGQEHIVRTLVNQIKSGSISHAYIFTGTRGTGKTTTAKIFARAVNCLSPENGSPCGECLACKSGAEGIDVLELDGASNNGVDEIRALRDNSGFPPVNSRYKVYIIDEVHMLTINAFNALLKTLEEPPKHMIFILATTEIHKVPQTVLSRCMRFDFRLVPADIIAARIAKIFDELKVKYEEQAVYALAKLGEGSVRDALSYADIVLAYSDGFIRYKDVLDALMVNAPDEYIPLSEYILSGEIGGAVRETERLLKSNSNVNILRRELCDYFKNLIFIKTAGRGGADGLPKELYEAMKPVADKYEARLLYRALEIFVRLESDMRYSSNPAIFLESAVIRAADSLSELDETGILIRLKNLENRLADEVKKNSFNIEKGIENGGIIPQNLSNSNTENGGIVPQNLSGSNIESGGIVPQNLGNSNIENGGIVLQKIYTEAEARAVLGNVVKAFRKRGHLQLFASFSSVYDVAAEDGFLTVYFTDEADYNSFCLDANLKTAQALLHETTDLKFKPILKKQNDNTPGEEINRLKEMFEGMNIIVK